MKTKRMTLLITALLTFFTLPIFAQNDLGKISGKIFDGQDNNTPLVGATVVASNESTGFQAGAVTNASGIFMLGDLPLGGPYAVEISFVGYTKKTFKGITLNMGDHIVIPDVVLTAETSALDEVVISEFSYKSKRDRIGVATRIDSETMSKLPTTSRNYQDLAQLSPLTRGTNIAGSRGNMRGLTIDGVSNRMHMFGSTAEGAFPVSMEAIREFEIVTNTYSVADGRGGAGTIKAVSKSGTNQLKASVWGYYTGGDLAGVEVENDDDDWKRGEKGEYTNSQYGFSLSGPIVKDKLHFFVAVDRFTQQIPWKAWDFEGEGATLADAENNLGITKENLDIVVNHLENNFGVPDVQQYGTMNVNRVTDNFFARFDWTINDKHRLMARYNWHVYIQPDKKPGGNRGLFSAQYEGRQQDHSVLLNLKSRLSYTMNNELKISYMGFKRLGENLYPRVPVGIAVVNSQLPNGDSKDEYVFFGNQYWAPEVIASNDFQLIDNFSFVSGKTRFMFGTDFQYNHINDLLTHYQQGEFIYYTLDNLLNNEPDEYNRKVPMTDEADDYVNPNILSLGLYGEASLAATEDLNLTAGLRWDMTYLPVAPKPDPLLENELGLRSDVTPKDINNFQPRFNLSWDVMGNGTDFIKTGFGWFVSEFTSQALSFAMINNAGNFKSVSARKTEGNMPEADWEAFYEDFDNVPGYENWLAPQGIDVSGIPNSVHIIDEDLETPMTFKTHLSYSKFITNKFVLTGGFYFNQTTNNYMMENMNLKDNPEFTVPGERNRGIYVDPSEILSNGGADYNDARKSTQFNEVMMFTNADWANTSWNAVIEAAYRIKDGEIKASYTYGQSKGGVRYNSGNPKDKFYTTTSYSSYRENAANWIDDDDMRHKVVATILSPTIKGFSLNMNMLFYQWDHFHSTVNRDQNGDDTPFSDNEDMSYIFDPETAPVEIREDLRYVWENTSANYREYLDDFKGGFAEPNGGIQPWRNSVDLSLVKNIKLPAANSIELRVDVFNVLNLLNYKWGGYNYVTNTRLYNITGFDTETNNYTYAVNKNAGKMRYRVGSNELYRIQVGIKYRFH